jgi:ribosomal protein S18 acetylase RimI-like enzyme
VGLLSVVSRTLIAQTGAVAFYGRQLPWGYEVRSLQKDDAPALAELYLAAYPSEIVRDLAAAREEMQRTFEGEYGPLVAGLSPAITTTGRLVATVMTVAQAPWPDTPAGLFVIEVITDPAHRRQGLAKAGLGWVATRAQKHGFGTLALRVDAENSAALALYRKLGFRDWFPGAEDERP